MFVGTAFEDAGRKQIMRGGHKVTLEFNFSARRLSIQETWGNDNVGLPGAFYEQYLRDFYRGDKLAKGELVVSGRRIDLGALTMPLHCVSFAHDSIVPVESAKELVAIAGSPDKVASHLGGGHVGAVVAKSAAEKLWPKLAGFWEARDDLARAEAPAGAATEVAPAPRGKKRATG